MSETKESGSLNQDDIAKLLNEMQSEENSSEPEKNNPSHESKANESSSLNQDDISKLLNQVQNEEQDPAPEEKPDSTESKSNESSTLSQDDISNLLNQVQNEEQGPAPEEKPDSTESKSNESKSLSQDDISNLLDEEKANQKEDPSEEISDDEMMKEKNSAPEDDNSFEGLDSLSDDDMEASDDEMDIDEPEIAIEPPGEVEKPAIEIKKDSPKKQKIILQEVKVSSNKKWLTISLILIFCTLIGIGIFIGYKFYLNPDTKINQMGSPSQPTLSVNPANKIVGETPKPGITNSPVESNQPNTNVIVKLEEITNLRKELAIKEDEIAELIKNYKDGIRQMEAEILKIKQTHQINTFRDAVKDKKIEFGMMTIQRRLAYIESIKQPYEWLNQGIEELQYLKNKIEIDAQISRVISGVDMDKMVREIDVVLQEYRTGIETLQIKMDEAGHISLEAIWKRILNKENTATGKNNISEAPYPNRKLENGNGKNKNQVIWKEICNGYFKRKNEMTTLSVNAAKCLSKWRHADLILNGLTDLSPKAAKRLLKWKGNWICLNGIKKLSPETAEYLFQWHGNLISLNGLPEISSGMVKSLPHWQGKQLELMGLKYKKTKRERIGLKALADWEASGGKLYIPVGIRKAIRALD